MLRERGRDPLAHPLYVLQKIIRQSPQYHPDKKLIWDFHDKCLQSLMQNEAQEREAEEVDNDPWYIEVTDNDCHHYVIPEDRRHDWWKWVESENWDVPDYATPIDGTFRFKQWTV